jgi:hypothetical protein
MLAKVEENPPVTSVYLAIKGAHTSYHLRGVMAVTGMLLSKVMGCIL